MTGRSFLPLCGVAASALAAVLAVPFASAQVSSSADFSKPIELRSQTQNQYPGSSGGGYGNGGYRQYPKYGESDFHHLAIEAGGGFTPIAGNTGRELKLGYNFTVGAGYNLNRHLGLMAEYHFDRLGIQDSLLAAVQASSGVSSLNGNAHVWSLTLDPIYNIRPKAKFGGYVTGGGGFYRRLTSFTQPIFLGYYYDYYYGYVPQYGNQTISHYSSNQGGLNIGGGFTFRPNSTSSGRIFAEARYEWVNTPSSTSSNTTFAPGSTKLIPVTLGYRW